MRRLGALVLVVAFGGAPALARRTAAPPRFPANLSEAVMRELLDAGRVEPRGGATSAAALAWGAAPLDSQASSMRAVVQALAGTRPSLDVAAAILAIARVESGWNAKARNPASSACGLFQFVRGTWERYGGSHENCADPALNASLGVEHLTSIYQTYVQPRLGPVSLVTTETGRVAWTYRMLYAYHYHGEGSPEAPEGGGLEAQSAAEAGMPPLLRFFSILKKATGPAPGPRLGPTRAAARHTRHRRS